MQSGISDGCVKKTAVFSAHDVEAEKSTESGADGIAVVSVGMSLETSPEDGSVSSTSPAGTGCGS
jgi:hypothetical protein